ncbi:MAG: YggU family protein [Chloroflexi bacterium]|nr:YggU family protein [Chloroflexota bacterium]
MGQLKITEVEGGVTFAVRVVPRASRNEIVGVQGDALKVRLTAPPVEGKANEALVAFLAQRLGVRKSQVEIVAGGTSPQELRERLFRLP